MDDLIESLIKEHRLIQAAIDELSKISEAGAGDIEKIQKLERLILAHIEKEDSEVYTPVKKLLKLPPQSAEIVESARHRIKDAKILAIIFFEKYKDAKGDEFKKYFPADLLRLAQKLRERILFEEEEFFPKLRDFWLTG